MFNNIASSYNCTAIISYKLDFTKVVLLIICLEFCYVLFNFFIS